MTSTSAQAFESSDGAASPPSSGPPERLQASNFGTASHGYGTCWGPRVHGPVWAALEPQEEGSSARLKLGVFHGGSFWQDHR